MPALLEKGEMVFTPEQVDNVISNLRNSMYIPPNSMVNKNYTQPSVQQKSTTINMNFGDIKLTDVRDVDGFAKAMGRDFAPLMRQEMSKRL